MATQMSGLRQPHRADCWNPNTLSPTPPAIRARPLQSIGAGRLSFGGLEMAISASAISATGMLIQKIARQVHWIRYPPAIGPIAVRPPAMPKNSASARPPARAPVESSGSLEDRTRSAG
jgi:hypothetical protein